MGQLPWGRLDDSTVAQLEHRLTVIKLDHAIGRVNRDSIDPRPAVALAQSVMPFRSRLSYPKSTLARPFFMTSTILPLSGPVSSMFSHSFGTLGKPSTGFWSHRGGGRICCRDTLRALNVNVGTKDAACRRWAQGTTDFSTPHRIGSRSVGACSRQDPTGQIGPQSKTPIDELRAASGDPTAARAAEVIERESPVWSNRE